MKQRHDETVLTLTFKPFYHSYVEIPVLTRQQHNNNGNDVTTLMRISTINVCSVMLGANIIEKTFA